MDNKTSLSQYFDDTQAPPASQFFDEIGTSPVDMSQSVYLGEVQGNSNSATDLFPPNMTASFSQQKEVEELSFTNVVPIVSGASALPAASLPDPSTFFDTIGPEPPKPQPVMSKATPSPNNLVSAMGDLTIKTNPQQKQVEIEDDRRRDAWLPDKEAKKILMKVQSSPKGSYFPDRESQTMPGIVLEEELADALQEAAAKLLGMASAGARGVLRADHVSKDETGLRELIRTGHYRAAINLSTTLLTQAGQGAGRAHRPTKNTPRTLHLWLARFLVMMRLRMADSVAREAEPFGNCEKPDMFFEFYPGAYENRSGTMAPFSLRLLLAELPAHQGKPEEAIDRLYLMLDVMRQMLDNLRAGKMEDGTGSITEQDKKESVLLWTGRETRVIHSIVNCAIIMKDYRLAGGVSRDALAAGRSPQQRRQLAGALARLWLLAGHVQQAAACLEVAKEARHQFCPTGDTREFTDLGLLEVAQGRYPEAYACFARAADQEPTNIMLANAMSVCLLYMGRLKEAIAIQQKAINSNPERGLNETLLLNLCTLYELESSQTGEKKMNLLRMMCKYKSDTFPNIYEVLKLT